MTTTFDQDGVLARLHRYQTMLVMGGGTAITVLVLLAAVLEVVASVMTYVARTNEEVSVDVRHVMDFTARATATLRNNVQNMELAWERAEAPDSKRLQAYIEAGKLVRVNASAAAPSLLVLGSTHQDDPAQDWRYIDLAQQMAPATAVIAARNAGDLSAYFYSPERSVLILAVAPWPGAEWQIGRAHV